ncbi:hypothetical protein NDU88_006822 [Pleurodeles waltl]|uniref:Uncharacterized protein n=1 Tax=Pleurodeles waltl TaxID=8319 RepID=A0AAV7X1S8_PLEWA|nr:hypothetical protein NDU88_006822 [Pleurodeles waltl]
MVFTSVADQDVFFAESRTYCFSGAPRSIARAAPPAPGFQCRSTRVFHSAITRRSRAPRASLGPSASQAFWAAPSGLCQSLPPLRWFRNWEGMVFTPVADQDVF